MRSPRPSWSSGGTSKESLSSLLDVQQQSLLEVEAKLRSLQIVAPQTALSERAALEAHIASVAVKITALDAELQAALDKCHTAAASAPPQGFSNGAAKDMLNASSSSAQGLLISGAVPHTAVKGFETTAVSRMISYGGPPPTQNIGSAKIPPASPAFTSREISQRAEDYWRDRSCGNYQARAATLLAANGTANLGAFGSTSSTQQLSARSPIQRMRSVPSTQQLSTVPSMPQFSAVPPMPQLSEVVPPMLQPSPSTQQLSPSPSTQQLSTVPPLVQTTQQLGAVHAPTAQQRLEELQPLSLNPSVQLHGVVSQNQARLGSPKLQPRGESITAQSSFSGPSAGYFQFSTGAPPPAVRSLNAEDSSGVVHRERRRSGAYPTGQQNAENLRAIRENSLFDNDLRNPKRLGTAPQDEDGEKDLSDAAVRLQKKLAGITQSDRRVI